MTDRDCWRSEYDWDVSRRADSPSRDTVLCVLFDSGAQRQFSSVRITLLISDNVAPEHQTEWVRRLPLHFTFAHLPSANYTPPIFTFHRRPGRARNTE